MIRCPHYYARNDRQPTRNQAGLCSVLFFFFTVPKKEKCFRDEPASADCEAQMACCVM